MKDDNLAKPKSYIGLCSISFLFHPVPNNKSFYFFFAVHFLLNLAVKNGGEDIGNFGFRF
jgi:hypothetical protein